MNGCCPGCGLKGSVEVFLVDAAHKSAFAEAIKLPRPVQEQLVAYLRLFAPPERGLTGPRTLRLVRELAELVAAGDVVGLERQAPRPCPPKVWAEAMRQMSERKGGGQAHMANHNYLRAVAYDLANKADAKAEARSHAEPLRPRREPQGGQADRSEGSDPSISPEQAEANRQAFFAAVQRIGKAMP